jgi:hypothetical protein
VEFQLPHSTVEDFLRLVTRDIRDQILVVTESNPAPDGRS